MPDYRVHLVIPCWSGARRGQPFSRSYVPEQLLWLEKVRHELVTRVTFVDAVAPEFHPDHVAYLARAESLGHRVLRRRNARMSYGSYSDAFELYGEEPFTHWMFLEDDYVMVVDDWDEKFCSMYEEILGNEGYLCSLVKVHGARYGRHGICSIGMASTYAVNRAHRRDNGFFKHQGKFTKQFGHIEDTTSRFRTVFYRGWAPIDAYSRYVVVGDGLPDLCLPVQSLGVPKEIFDARSGPPLEDRIKSGEIPS